MTTADARTETRVDDGLIHLMIDDVEVAVPKGTLVIRAAELVGVDIPRFCDHPLLDPVGACRQCLVEIEGMRKPMASCTIPVTEGMVVRTQRSSAEAESAQRGVMELLLINHPLDCPTCDKGGECPLQNQAMSAGRTQSRFDGTKRVYTKPVALSSEVLLDRERCVLCARCTRFSEQIAGDPLIALTDRGALQQVAAYRSPGAERAGSIDTDEPFHSYFSGNTVQICPVGALTGAAYRFRARPFDLVSSPSVCEHCASGCAQRTDHRRGRVLRRLAGDDPNVNEEWNCDKGRWAFAYERAADRLTTPLARGDDGALRPVSWPYALAVAARGLAAAGDRTAVLTGGRVTVEDAYAYAKFARVALHTNNIDFRIRDHSEEETQFLAALVSATGITVDYDDLEQAPAVVLAGLEPEEESPMIFLRLRKAVGKHGQRIASIAAWRSPGLAKLSGTLLSCVPGGEAAVLDDPGTARLLDAPGSILAVGERLAGVPGALSAAARLAASTGARLAWVPRRAGERGAADVGALPTVLPGGRPVSSPKARAELATLWKAVLPADDGLDAAGIVDALHSGSVTAVVCGGVEPADLPGRTALAAALDDAFVVSLEQRPGDVTERADVVLPVAVVAEKDGTFVDWEGRPRWFTAAVTPPQGSAPLSDHRVLDALAAELGVELHCDDPRSIHSELHRMGSWSGQRPEPPSYTANHPATAGSGRAVLASWRMLLDAGRLQDGEPHLAGTAHRSVVRLSAATAAEIGAVDGEPVRVSTSSGAITLPLTVTDMPPRVVWTPMNSTDSQIHVVLDARPGDVVRIEAARSEPETPDEGDTDG
ncbi:MAG: NADH-quinone oxidoreductase subunit G [Gordonia sp. (in: high G+C Gram-positive bacteria)]